jgi:MFS family permease
MLIVGRFIAGISIGVLSMIVPVYQAEISPPHARGLMSGWTQLMIVWGFFVANWVGYGCQFLTNSGQWRIPLAIQIVPAIALLGGMFVLPYSPRWLAKQDRLDESKATLMRLHGGTNTANTIMVEAEFEEMLAQIEWERKNVATNFKVLFADRASIHRTLCGCLIQSMCQWTGVNVNNYL